MYLDIVYDNDNNDKLLIENVLSDFLNNDIINESIEYNNLLKKSKEKLKLFINNFKSLISSNKKVKDESKRIEKKIKQETSYLANKYSKTNLAISSNQKSLQDDMQDILKSVIFDINFDGIPEAIVIALIIFIVNTLALTILSVLCGGTIGYIITTVIVAPLTEELGKFISMKNDNLATFELVFNITEFTSYILEGVNPILRLIPVGIHYITGFVQKLIYTHVKDDNEDNSNIAYIAGVCIHSLYNSLCVLEVIMG